MRGTGRAWLDANAGRWRRLVYRKPIALQLRSGTGQSSSRSMLVKGSIFLKRNLSCPLAHRRWHESSRRCKPEYRRHSRYNPRDPHTSEWRLETGFVLLGMDAIGRADLDAKGILDARISDYIGHDESISKRK